MKVRVTIGGTVHGGECHLRNNAATDYDYGEVTISGTEKPVACTSWEGWRKLQDGREVVLGRGNILVRKAGA
jgi:hypothetical protein